MATTGSETRKLAAILAADFLDALRLGRIASN
jgi:hypothetical protein